LLGVLTPGLDAKKDYYSIKPENFKSSHVC